MEGENAYSGYEGVDYGKREILKDNFEEINRKNLPYQIFHLYNLETINKYGSIAFDS